MSELIAAADLMIKGWEVYRALSPNSRCDLIAMSRDGKERLDIEVRTGYQSRATLKVCFSATDKDKDKMFAVVIYEDAPRVVYFKDRNTKMEIRSIKK